MSPNVTLCLLSLVTFACRSVPVTGARATGERLSTGMASGTEAGHFVGDNWVGRRGYTTFDGYRQGTEPIDEEDFFRIAGDVEAAEAIRVGRQRSVTAQGVGVAALAVGAAGAGVGALLMALNPPGDESMPQSPQSAQQFQAGLISGLIGVALGVTGWVVLGAANAALEPGSFFFLDKDNLPTRGNEAARKYNVQLERSARPSDAPTRLTLLPR